MSDIPREISAGRRVVVTGMAGAPGRHCRIGIFCEICGVLVPVGITGCVAWLRHLILQICQAPARQGIEPQATWVREGYLGMIRARISWTESHQVP